jgi:Protein of unknown function (DUF429)
MAAVLILQLQPGLLNLTMRRTDVFVHEQLRLTPLSVSADRIAHVAFRCAVLLAKLDAADAPVDRSGSGPVAEVYPAASADQRTAVGPADRYREQHRPDPYIPSNQHG